jgi:hypothetical protein
MWIKALQQCMADSRHMTSMTHVQVGTVSADGDPSVRTLAFRELITDSLVFAVDARGDVVPDIQHRPRAEVCWYCIHYAGCFLFLFLLLLYRQWKCTFQKSILNSLSVPLCTEQFRLRCDVELVGWADTAHALFGKRAEIWAHLDDDQRQARERCLSIVEPNL